MIFLNFLFEEFECLETFKETLILITADLNFGIERIIVIHLEIMLLTFNLIGLKS